MSTPSDYKAIIGSVIGWVIFLAIVGYGGYEGWVVYTAYQAGYAKGDKLGHVWAEEEGKRLHGMQFDQSEKQALDAAEAKIKGTDWKSMAYRQGLDDAFHNIVDKISRL